MTSPKIKNQNDTKNKKKGGMHLVYVPFPNLKEATRAAKSLLAAKLVACANITPGVLSIFHDGAAIREQPEAVVIFKTMAGKVGALRQTLAHLHPYETPAILEWEVTDVNQPYLQWVQEALKD